MDFGRRATRRIRTPRRLIFAQFHHAAVRRSVRTIRVALTLLCLIASVMPTPLAAQSLAEVARKEAERRRDVDRQGLAAKVIDGDPAQLAPNGNLSTSSPAPRPRAGDDRAGPRSRETPRSYRTRIQKLDRDIRSGDDRIAALRERLRAERWAPPREGRLSRSSSAAASQERLQAQVRELESKLKQLKRERREVYDEGRRAGFQPGELDGKGHMP